MIWDWEGASDPNSPTGLSNAPPDAALPPAPAAAAGAGAAAGSKGKAKKGQQAGGVVAAQDNPLLDVSRCRLLLAATAVAGRRCCVPPLLLASAAACSRCRLLNLQPTKPLQRTPAHKATHAQTQESAPFPRYADVLPEHVVPGIRAVLADLTKQLDELEANAKPSYEAVSRDLGD